MLCTGIEQGHYFSRFRINGVCRSGFAEVARRTGKTQIRGGVPASGIDMLDMQRLTDRRLTRLAVFTAMPCASVDKTDNSGPGQFTHQLERTRLGVWYILVRPAGQRPWLFADSIVAPVQLMIQVPFVGQDLASPGYWPP